MREREKGKERNIACREDWREGIGRGKMGEEERMRTDLQFTKGRGKRRKLKDIREEERERNIVSREI